MRSYNRTDNLRPDLGVLTASNFFYYLSLYPGWLLSERFFKTALVGSKSYLFLCLFIFQRQALFQILHNQLLAKETLFRTVSKKTGVIGATAAVFRSHFPARADARASGIVKFRRSGNTKATPARECAPAGGLQPKATAARIHASLQYISQSIPSEQRSAAQAFYYTLYHTIKFCNLLYPTQPAPAIPHHSKVKGKKVW
jgi:hypothetical protein